MLRTGGPQRSIALKSGVSGAGVQLSLPGHTTDWGEFFDKPGFPDRAQNKEWHSSTCIKTGSVINSQQMSLSAES